MSLIQQFLKQNNYQIDHIGMSKSQILIGKDAVLKIQDHHLEAQNEYQMMKLLEGKLNVPKVLEMEVIDEKQYLLMSKIEGVMSCDKSWMNQPDALLEVLKGGLECLWSIDISNFNCIFTLEKKLEIASYRVYNHLMDIDDINMDLLKRYGFNSPLEALEWLKQQDIKEELVLSHGDFCLPNLFIRNGKLDSFIDLGRMGVGDKWQDISILYRSLNANYSGVYGYKNDNYHPQDFFKTLNIELDEQKLKFYLLLDELM